MNFWPPFLGAGIKVKKISDTFNDITVEMKLTKLNRNYVGTQFGGSIYAMTDPFYMMILMKIWAMTTLSGINQPTSNSNSRARAS